MPNSEHYQQIEGFDDTIQQIADLINTQNHLSWKVTTNFIADNINEYIVFINPETKQVIGVARFKRLTWYASELSHLSVHPDHKKKGWGTAILDLASEYAVNRHNTYAIQCTVRTNNEPSLKLFEKNKYVESARFKNPKTNNEIVMLVKNLY